MNSPLPSIAAQLALGLSVGFAGRCMALSVAALELAVVRIGQSDAGPGLAARQIRAHRRVISDARACRRLGLLAGMMGFLLARGVTVRRYGGSQ